MHKFHQLPWDDILPYLTLLERICVIRAYPPIHLRLLRNKRLLNNALWAREQFEKNGVGYYNYEKAKINNPDLKVFIIGGFALGLLRGIIFSNSDLDLLYFKQDSNGTKSPVETITIIYSDYEVGKQQSIIKFSPSLQWQGYGEISYAFGLIKTQGGSRTQRCLINTDHLSLIKSVNSVYRYLDEVGDLEFTKVVFDGQNFRFKDLEAIVKRRCIFSLSKEFKRKHTLLREVAGQDYKDDSGNLWQFTCDRMCSRIQKYRLRGFTVDTKEPIVKKWISLDNFYCGLLVLDQPEQRTHYLLVELERRLGLYLDNRPQHVPQFPYLRIRYRPGSSKWWLDYVLALVPCTRAGGSPLRRKRYLPTIISEDRLRDCVTKYHLNICEKNRDLAKSVSMSRAEFLKC